MKSAAPIIRFATGVFTAVLCLWFGLDAWQTLIVVTVPIVGMEIALYFEERAGR